MKNELEELIKFIPTRTIYEVLPLPKRKWFLQEQLEIIRNKAKELLIVEKKNKKALTKECLGLLADKSVLENENKKLKEHITKLKGARQMWKDSAFEISNVRDKLIEQNNRRKKTINIAEKEITDLEDGLTAAYMSGFYEGKKCQN